MPKTKGLVSRAGYNVFLSLLAAGLLSSAAQSVSAQVEGEVSETEKKSTIATVTSAPMKAAGIMTGIMVGIPVRICKDTAHYSKRMKGSMDDGLNVKGNNDAYGHTVSAASSLVFGIPTGIIHGSIEGARTGYESGKKKPFSKESMSLGEVTYPPTVNNYD